MRGLPRGGEAGWNKLKLIMMHSPEERRAIELFRSGYNCAQTVVSSFSERMNFDMELAAALSAGFGGGMGRLQKTCGAVTGAFMVLGIYNYRKYSETTERKNRASEMVREFFRRFDSIYGTTDCKSLIECDISAEEGRRIAKENGIFERVCEPCIADAVKIVLEMTK